MYSFLSMLSTAQAFIGFERSMDSMYLSIAEKQSQADDKLRFSDPVFNERTQKYNNPWPTWRRLSPADLLRWKVESAFGIPDNELELNRELEKNISISKP